MCCIPNWEKGGGTTKLGYSRRVVVAVAVANNSHKKGNA